jgi:tRNA modification GTPase
VTPIAGTTRDVLEVELELGGLPLRLCDTAGLRAEADADPIEAEGMRRARALLADAPLRLLVADVSAGRAPSVAELSALLAGEAPSAGVEPEAAVRDAIIVLNKVDALALSPGAPPPHVAGVPVASQFLVSCESGEGFEPLLCALEARVRALLEGGDEAGEAVVVTRARHREHLEQVLLALERFEAHDGLMVDLAAEELRIAAAEVGKVTGRIQIDEMLDIIFRDFCIGK